MYKEIRCQRPSIGGLNTVYANNTESKAMICKQIDGPVKISAKNQHLGPVKDCSLLDSE